MRSPARAGAAGLGALAASGAMLLLSPGAAVAQESPAPCEPNAYPPQNCTVEGGAGRNAPPVVVDRTVAAPGSDVAVKVTSGCRPNSPVMIALVRMANGATPIGLANVTSDANGGYDTSVLIPLASDPGVYVLYSTCPAADSDDLIVSTTSFVIVPSENSNAGLRTKSSDSAAPAAAGTTAATPTAAAQDLPDTWTAPAAWRTDARTRAAVEDAVNLRLAAMRSALPAQDAPAAAPEVPPAAPTDLTPWVAGGGAALLLTLGAAGWRRRTTTTNEVSA